MQAGRTSPLSALTSSSPLQGRKTAPSGLRGGNAVPSPVLRCIELVASEMQQSELELHQLLSPTLPIIEEIQAYLANAGGKRLRPLITALGARAVDSQGSIARLMCVGELLHLGSLLHDDVVDDGIERRGKPAAQRVYGNPASVLAGDVCLAKSISLASQEAGLTAVQHLAEAVVGMAEGEVLQLQHIGNLNLDLETYTDIIQRKSARLIAWCAAAGAWREGKEDLAKALMQYGTEVGIAFQITDDVLDYIGDKRLTGKRRGKDLAEGKLTLPLVIALNTSPSLRERLQRGIPSPERIPALIDEVCASQAPQKALEMARLRVGLGIAALEPLEDSPWRDALIELAHYLVDRVS